MKYEAGQIDFLVERIEELKDDIEWCEYHRKNDPDDYSIVLKDNRDELKACEEDLDFYCQILEQELNRLKTNNL